MWLRPRRYAYLARKYWRKNKLKHWWILHVVDEIRFDWHHRHGICDWHKETGKCHECQTH